ncbi:hypothetical protein G6F56_006679 [Rhizopus delemar]|nr:hypothetical protein G6F56_006679 [Rhizopus delemar]
MKYAQQIANYEVVKINTAYLNGVSLQFGKKLRMFLNLILNKTNRIQALKSKMKDMGHSKEDISAAVKTINKQCTEVKLGMRPQVESRQLKFRGTIYTDGVGISILKQNHDSKKKRSGGKQKKVDIDEDVPYVHTLSKEQLLADTGKCILVDPGRRNMLYCMHESSTIQKKSVYRYTNNQRNVETKTRKFRNLRENSKSAAVTAAEASLGRFCSSTVVPQKFVDYLHQRAEVTGVLGDYYANEDLSKEERPDGVLPFRKMKLSSFINRQQSDKRLCRSIRGKFGDDTIIVIGQLEKFKEVNNPRPFRRNTRPKVICHDLLRCTKQQCLKDADTPRLWNRDLVATLNFREILFELRKNGTRPICFRRPSANYASKQKGSFSDEHSKNKRHKANPL